MPNAIGEPASPGSSSVGCHCITTTSDISHDQDGMRQGRQWVQGMSNRKTRMGGEGARRDCQEARASSAELRR